MCPEFLEGSILFLTCNIFVIHVVLMHLLNFKLEYFYNCSFNSSGPQVAIVDHSGPHQSMESVYRAEIYILAVLLCLS